MLCQYNWQQWVTLAFHRPSSFELLASCAKCYTKMDLLDALLQYGQCPKQNPFLRLKNRCLFLTPPPNRLPLCAYISHSIIFHLVTFTSWSRSYVPVRLCLHCIYFFPIEQSVISQDEIYFQQFLSVLYEEIIPLDEAIATEVRSNATDKKKKGKQSKNSVKVTGPAVLSNRFHKCLCAECVSCGTWLALPDFITNRLPYSGLQIDIIGRNSVRLTGNYVNMFVSIDDSKDQLPTVAIIFHNKIKVLVRHHSSWRRTLQREVDIISKQYSVSFRNNSVSFTSDANLLTYSIDKSGCKTKICKQTNIGQDDFVTKLFQCELKRIEAKRWSNLKQNKKDRDTNARRKTGKAHISPAELLKKCRLKSSSSEQDLIWSIDGKCVHQFEQQTSIANWSLFHCRFSYNNPTSQWQYVLTKRPIEALLVDTPCTPQSMPATGQYMHHLKQVWPFVYSTPTYGSTPRRTISSSHQQEQWNESGASRYWNVESNVVWLQVGLHQEYYYHTARPKAKLEQRGTEWQQQL